MSVTIDELQKFIDKEATIHLIQGDGTLKEITGTIKAATVAGVPFKEKGKSSLELTTADKIEEIALAPVKAKPVSKKKVAPIELGQARQHLADRHGISLDWCRNASEQEAFDFHAGVDHKDLGHEHVAKEDKKDEREQALTDGENAGA